MTNPLHVGTKAYLSFNLRHFWPMKIWVDQKKKFMTKFLSLYLEADPLDVEDSQDVFMIEEGDTPPLVLLVISNGTVV